MHYDNFYLCSMVLYTSTLNLEGAEAVIADLGRGCLEVQLVLPYHVKQNGGVSIAAFASGSGFTGYHNLFVCHLGMNVTTDKMFHRVIEEAYPHITAMLDELSWKCCWCLVCS